MCLHGKFQSKTSLAEIVLPSLHGHIRPVLHFHCALLSIDLKRWILIKRKMSLLAREIELK